MDGIGTGLLATVLNHHELRLGIVDVVQEHDDVGPAFADQVTGTHGFEVLDGTVGTVAGDILGAIVRVAGARAPYPYIH